MHTDKSRLAPRSLVLLATAAALVSPSGCRAQPEQPQQPATGSSGCVRPAAPHGIATDAEAAVFRYDASAALDVRLSEPSTLESGVRQHTIGFRSPGGGTVPGLLWVPPGGGPFAGVVMQHGIPQTAADMTYDAVTMARRGAVVIAITAPVIRRGAPPQAPTDSSDQVQLIRELQRAVDILVRRPDVDSTRLGYFGYSYGAAMGALLAGVERRIRTYVLSAGDGGLVAHFTGPDDPPHLVQRVPCAWLASMTPIEPIRFVPRAAPASLFLQAAQFDEYVPPDDARRLHAAASEPKVVRWYPTRHDLGELARADRVDWFTERLALRR